MVDINLFEDDAEEQDGLGDELGGIGDDAFSDDALGGDDFGGDLSLEDDLGDEESFGDENLLDSDEQVPDFEEAEDEIEDYAFEGTRKKAGIPPWMLFLVGGAVIVFLLIQFVVPMLFAPKPVAVKSKTPTVNRPRVQTQTQPPAGQTAQGNAQKPAQTAQNTTQGTQPAAQQNTAISTPPPAAASGTRIGQFDVLSSTKNVFETLSGEGQAGVVLIDGSRFLVEYVSATPGVSQAMGNRIQQLIGASQFEASPEEKHTTEGKEHYWGVISGTLPASKAYGSTGTFASVAAFEKQVSSLLKQNGLELKSVEKPAGVAAANGRPASGHMIVEGKTSDFAAFINAMQQLPGQWGVNKLLFAPVNISDFYAKQAKIGITFWVAVG